MSRIIGWGIVGVCSAGVVWLWIYTSRPHKTKGWRE